MFRLFSVICLSIFLSGPLFAIEPGDESNAATTAATLGRELSSLKSEISTLREAVDNVSRSGTVVSPSLLTRLSSLEAEMRDLTNRVERALHLLQRRVDAVTSVMEQEDADLARALPPREAARHEALEKAELAFKNQDFESAALSFFAAYAHAPNYEMEGQALLGLAQSYQSLEKPELACRSFLDVLVLFEASDVARIAQDRFEALACQP